MVQIYIHKYINVNGHIKIILKHTLKQPVKVFLQCVLVVDHERKVFLGVEYNTNQLN